MKSLTELSAESIANTDIVAIDSGQPLSKTKAKMEEHNLHEIPVVDGKEFKGIVSYRDLIDNIHVSPTTTKVDSIMQQPPKARADMNLIELANLRKNSGNKRFILKEGDRLRAVIGEEDIVYPLGDGVEELRKFTIADLMNTDLITLEEGDKHDKAVEAMRTHNISHIPITDSNGRVEGLLSEFDLLKSMVRRQKMDSGDVKGEKNKFADIPCQELMDPNPLSISDLSISIFDAIKMLRSRGCRQLVVVDQDDKSQAILTLKDIIDYIASFQSQEAVLVNLINVDSDGEKQAIHEKLENALQGSLGRILERPTELNLHVKQYEKDGKRHKYSVHAKLFSELGTTMVHGHGWELLNVVDEIVNNLTERIKKEKSKRRDRVRERWKDGDYQV